MDQGKRTKESQGENIKESSKIGGLFKVGPPQFQDKRLAIFDSFWKEQQELFKKAEHKPITISLKDGKQIPGIAFETTPLEIATKISKKLAEASMVAKISYKNRVNCGFQGDIVDTDKEENKHSQDEKKVELWDLARPLEGDCLLELLNFEDPQGKETFWHSSAHLLGASLESLYGSQLCIGPPLDNGFFYDSYMGEFKVSQTEYEKIEKEYQKLTAEKAPFQRIVLTKEQALDLFASNPFKVQLISNKIPEGGYTTAYKCGKLIDLCTGPHLPTTDRVKAFKVTKNSAAYWLGKNTNDDLQRVYGIAFPDKKQLAEYVRIQEELAKRDHRTLGKQHQLFNFHHFSPGSGFFFPNGAHIYNTLMGFLRKQYQLRGYSEVLSPNFYNVQLWKVSGHWDKYKENLFLIKMGDEGDYGVKPMNCPGHCLMFDMMQHSYRDLPIRYADFGVLHRNEVHGALSGLTRVRRFQQDDAHIFCRPDQIQNEIFQCLDFLAYVYKIFNFEYKLYLSTRPENYLGTLEIWDAAEDALKQSLDKFGKPYEINPGDGAFYGPKIDVKLYDAYKREHQCGTIQLDFNLPMRFNLQYRANEDMDEVKSQKEKLIKEQQDLASEIIERKQSSEIASQLEKTDSVDEEKVQIPAQGQEKSPSPTDQTNPLDLSFQKSNLSSHDVHSVIHEKKYDTGYHHLKPGFQRPIIVHRAILGSFERMIAILTEQFGGKWPFWLSPRQLCICPISEKYKDYAQKIELRLKIEGFQVDSDVSDTTINKKIRNAQLDQYNFIGAVGQEEESTGTIDIREREKGDRLGKFTIEDLILFLRQFEPSSAESLAELKKKAYYRDHDYQIQKLEDELSQNVFLSENGLEIGQRDHDTFQKLKADNVKINQKFHPNLFKWFRLLQHIQEKGAQKLEQQ